MLEISNTKMKTIELAKSAIHRLEIAEDSEWWDEQTDKFKKDYTRKHPHSKYVKRYGSSSKETNKKQKVLKKLDSKSPDFNKNSTLLVKRLASTDPDHVDKKQLHHVDDVLYKHKNNIKKKYKGIDEVVKTLSNKLKTAPKHQHSSIRAELKSAISHRNKLGKDLAKIKEKHDTLIRAHGKELRSKNATKFKMDKRKEVVHQILKERKIQGNLKEKRKQAMLKAKGKGKEKYIKLAKELDLKLNNLNKKIEKLKGFLK